MTYDGDKREALVDGEKEGTGKKVRTNVSKFYGCLVMATCVMDKRMEQGKRQQLYKKFQNTEFYMSRVVEALQWTSAKGTDVHNVWPTGEKPTDQTPHPLMAKGKKNQAMGMVVAKMVDKLPVDDPLRRGFDITNSSKVRRSVLEMPLNSTCHLNEKIMHAQNGEKVMEHLNGWLQRFKSRHAWWMERREAEDEERKKEIKDEQGHIRTDTIWGLIAQDMARRRNVQEQVLGARKCERSHGLGEVICHHSLMCRRWNPVSPRRTTRATCRQRKTSKPHGEHPQ